MRIYLVALLALLVLAACGRRGSLPPPLAWPQPHPTLGSGDMQLDGHQSVAALGAVPLRADDTRLECARTVPAYPWSQVAFEVCTQLPAGTAATHVTLPQGITALRLVRGKEPGPTIILEPSWRAAAYGTALTAAAESWLYYRDSTAATAVAPIDGRYRRQVRDVAGLRIYGPVEPIHSDSGTP